jgi:hypothetical protein
MRLSKSVEPELNKTIYIMGAGASRDGGIPLTKEILRVGYQLISDLSKRLGEKSIEYRKRKERGEPVIKLVSTKDVDFLDYLGYNHLCTFQQVYTFIERNLHWNHDHELLPNIEELWGVLEIASEGNANFGYGRTTSLEIKNALTHLMNYVLWGCRVCDEPNWHVSYNLPTSNPYEKFVTKLPNERVIISLNYDMEMDMAVRKANLPIDYGSDFIPYQPEDTELKEERGSEAVLLLKPHGSFNWLYCPTCHLIEDFGLFHVSAIPHEHTPYGEVDADLPCKYDQTLREPVIVPPSLIKKYSNPHLERIWQRIGEELKKAKKIVFIGYSLGGADIHVKYLLRQALSVNYHELYEKGIFITVVNKSKEAIKEYERWFGKDKIDVFEDSFSNYVEKRM